MLTLQEMKILYVSIQKLTTERHGPTHWLKERTTSKLHKNPSSFWGLPMHPSCAQPEGAGRQVLVSPPGVGPFPVITPLCIRKKESSLLPTWKKPFRPSDPASSPQRDFSLHTSCTWPEPQDRGRFRDADCPQRSQQPVHSLSHHAVCFWPSLATPEGLFAPKDDMTFKTEVWAELCSWNWITGTPQGCLQLRKARTDLDAGF